MEQYICTAESLPTLWGPLAHVDREETYLKCQSEPVISNNRYKNEIFQASRDNYLAACNKYMNREWSSCKTKIGKRPLLFLNNNENMPKIYFHSEYFDYTCAKEGHIWVSFANKHLGGGYKNTGWVQEEIITAEFYEMAVGITEYEKLKLNIMDIDEAVIWINLVRGSEALLDKYGGRHLRSENRKTFNVDNYLVPLKKERVLADFISIDAPNRKDRSKPYTLLELQHLFVKALAGFETCAIFDRKIIHTGNWGAGAFNNDPELIFWVQVLVAKLVGIREIHFWGTKDVTDNKRINHLMEKFFNDPCIVDITFSDLYGRTQGLFGIKHDLAVIFDHIITQ